MFDLPVAVSERVGGRARLPSLQNIFSMAQRRIEVKRKLSDTSPEPAVMTTEANDRQGLLREIIENMKENDERICHVIWH